MIIFLRNHCDRIKRHVLESGRNFQAWMPKLPPKTRSTSQSAAGPRLPAKHMCSTIQRADDVSAKVKGKKVQVVNATQLSSVIKGPGDTY